MVDVVDLLDIDRARRLRALELLAEHEQLHLVVDGQHTSTGDTTKDVGTGTLEERLDTLLGDDLLEGIDGRLVLDGLENKSAPRSCVSEYVL